MKCKHEWEYTEYKEPNFGITWAMKRKCKKCGKEEYANFAISRHGTPWMDKVGNL